MKGLNHIFRLGVKELRSLWADKVLLIILLVAFTVLVYSGAKGTSRELHNAPIAVVDQDRSPLSERIVGAFTVSWYAAFPIRSWKVWIVLMPRC